MCEGLFGACCADAVLSWLDLHRHLKKNLLLQHIPTPKAGAFTSISTIILEYRPLKNQVEQPFYPLVSVAGFVRVIPAGVITPTPKGLTHPRGAALDHMALCHVSRPGMS